MVRLARADQQAHLAPAPGTMPLAVAPFSAAVVGGLLAGVVASAIIGAVFGALLLNGTLVVPGWEQLYSLRPGAFVTFWVGLGIALGIVVGGIGAIFLTTPRPPAPAPHRPRHQADEPT